VIEGLSGSSSLLLRFVFLFALITAMFGSVLTLASFVKFIHAIFLGQDHSPGRKKVSEVSFNMGFPLVILGALCLILGLLPQVFLNIFIKPWMTENIYFIGSWNSVLAFSLVAAGLVLGWIFWKTAKTKQLRADDIFIGGEDASYGPSFPATEFYRSVEEMPLMRRAYALLKKESLDLYNILQGVLKVAAYILFFADRSINFLTSCFGYAVLGSSSFFRRLHSGVLDLYLAWSLFGLAILFFILMGH
jgi:hypothetical protein